MKGDVKGEREHASLHSFFPGIFKHQSYIEETNGYLY